MDHEQYLQATIATSHDLRTIAHSKTMRDMSKLSLPEIDGLVARIARVAPAGNVPGVILNGLSNLPKRGLTEDNIRRDIGLLFRGVEQALKDRAVYSAFFAGPAAVIFAYQSLLKLAGKSPEAAFPEGTWQFYVEYALRDDTARHTCETHGFATTLRQHNIPLSPVDTLTAWVLTAVHILHQYPRLLENEWRERVHIHLLAAHAPETAALYRQWEQQRPYARGADAGPKEDYPAYRRRRFDDFMTAATLDLPAAAVQAWQADAAALSASLAAYRQQMSIHAFLNPEKYRERRIPIPQKDLHVGVIHNGRYYLIRACQPDSDQPAAAEKIRAHVAALLAHPAPAAPDSLAPLARVQRRDAAKLGRGLGCRTELAKLRLAPIWINADRRPRHLPLADIRQAERAAGDQPLTIFFTEETAVFDLSHIFFDGAWGTALAEILTGEALSWAAWLHTLPPARPGSTRPYSPALTLTAAEQERIRTTPATAPEVSAETTAVNLPAILDLRRLFKQRTDLLRLTVNDLLLLYRAIHAVSYHVDIRLLNRLEALQGQPATRDAAAAALAAIDAAANPTILIPVDASRRLPSDRVFPLAFQVPLAELDLRHKHKHLLTLIARGDPEAAHLKKEYLGSLAGFGEVLSRAKEIANAGESASVGTIKLLAHMPAPLQQLLDGIPGRFDVLNDIIKGREVFSNVGQVAPSSSLTRFITAKDDNEKKTLAWGVLTDANRTMNVTLRDFRPHVALLTAVNHRDLAQSIAQDYLDAYAAGLNRYVAELRRIVTK